MAEATVPVLPAPLPDTLEARWAAVTTKPRRDADGWIIDNAPDCYRLDTIVQRWALSVSGDEGLLGRDPDGLDELTSDVLQDIHTRVIAWASTRHAAAIERRRESAA